MDTVIITDKEKLKQNGINWFILSFLILIKTIKPPITVESPAIEAINIGPNISIEPPINYMNFINTLSHNNNGW
jgi:hypothetical protein